MQFVDLQKFGRDSFIQTYGVPPELLGIVEASNRSTIAAASYLHALWNIVPRLEFIRATFQERLVPDFDDRVVIWYESPVDEDNEFYLRVIQAAAAHFSMDEIRKMGGQEPDPSGNGGLHFIPAKGYFGPVVPGAPPQKATGTNG